MAAKRAPEILVGGSLNLVASGVTLLLVRGARPPSEESTIDCADQLLWLTSRVPLTK
jgi:hypothetical protein